MKKVFLSIIIFVCIFLCQADVLAQEKNYPLLVKGEYFSVYAFPGLDVQQFLQKLNFDYFFQVEGLTAVEDSPREIVAKTLDAIYLEVSDTVGINAYSFEGNIKIFPDQATLAEEFRILFHKDFFERGFYFHETCTLYLSYEDVTIGMLAHEMAHMIMSNYFVVPSSPKLQEILSGYVEYHFRKLLKLPIE